MIIAPATTPMAVEIIADGSGIGLAVPVMLTKRPFWLFVEATSNASQLICCVHGPESVKADRVPLLVIGVASPLTYIVAGPLATHSPLITAVEASKRSRLKAV